MANPVSPRTSLIEEIRSLYGQIAGAENDILSSSRKFVDLTPSPAGKDLNQDKFAQARAAFVYDSSLSSEIAGADSSEIAGAENETLSSSRKFEELPPTEANQEQFIQARDVFIHDSYHLDGLRGMFGFKVNKYLSQNGDASVLASKLFTDKPEQDAFAEKITAEFPRNFPNMS